jgi:signal peptide peptidase SppA
MRFERMTRELYAKPWAIMPQVYDAFHATFQNMVEGRKLDASIEIFGEKIEYKLPEEYDVIQGVAVIQIDGVLGYRISEIDKACMGAVDYRDIRNAIAKANNDESVSSILLEINSPGGMVTGLKETAEFIANSAKATVAFTDSLCASAGYYLASSATSIYATESSDIGCIGTLMSWVDVSKAYEMQGIKRELIASGKYKGMFTPGLSLTDEQRAYLQDEVDELAEEFREYVTTRRNGVDQENMEGQTLMGVRAKQANLIDEIGGFEAALTEAIELGA